MPACTADEMRTDAIHEACGVFGVYGPGEDVARITYFGLFALQHRGQESAGIACADGREISLKVGMGLVQQVFDEAMLSGLRGDLAIGHTRYSTTGSSEARNAQPVLVRTKLGNLALAHNGNLVNARELHERLVRADIHLESTSDSAIMAHMIAEEWEKTGNLEQAIITASASWRGAYAVTALTEKQVLAFRDPNGIRPLCLGTINERGHVIASESCALNVIGAHFQREIDPGELVTIDGDGVRSTRLAPAGRSAMCVFEYIYFARPDSRIGGKLIHEARRRMGRRLARDYPVEADLVIPVPDTGWPAAIGYAEESGIPFGEGLIKNRYIARTFIQPDQRQRELGVGLKLTPMREVLEGKRVVMVDDSIVRGTTKRGVVNLVRAAGAREVHVRISAPPYQFPCFYGVDTSDRSQLIAARMDVEQIRQAIGADSLGYQTVEGLVESIGLPADRFCRACFDSEYPVAIPDEIKARKFTLEEDAPPTGAGA
jgi:amidophosphoribosyltransferase